MSHIAFVFGLTGYAGTGKDTVAKFLLHIASTYQIQSYNIRLSDLIRDDIQSTYEAHREISRTDLIQRGNELRDKEGQDVLAHKAIAGVNNFSCEPHPCIALIVGVRAIAEVITCRNQWNDKFTLLAVTSTERVRHIRMQERQQFVEDTAPSSDTDKADQEIGIENCIKMADVVIENNGEIRDLESFINSTFASQMRSIATAHRTNAHPAEPGNE